MSRSAKGGILIVRPRGSEGSSSRCAGIPVRALALIAILVVSATGSAEAAGTGQWLGYHEIQVDAQGMIVPWYSENPGVSYDHDIHLVWSWWKTRELCPNGVEYYLQHQVWSPSHDSRGLGGDQLAMALSSWSLLYAYTGDSTVIGNMRRIADYYLEHSLSSPVALWPNLPYPYNTTVHSGAYDGDMVSGPSVLQPDKAASFAAELLTLYEITGVARYLDAAAGIADTLAARVVAGDGSNSPWPFRVNAETGQVAVSSYNGERFSYTSNWTGALRLFDGLIRLGRGNVAVYAGARGTVSAWLKTYPMRNDNWGPFFEDVNRWSDTEINADTMAMYILEHPAWDGSWQADARAILDWSFATFHNDGWASYGATAINEQTAYVVPGNSHTSRHWSVELLFAEKTGDASRKAQALRGLNWATYMVDFDGKNRYPQDDIWLTDGYGDYVRHYLRAMAAAPELAPAAQNHLLRSTSVVTSISYLPASVGYTTFDAASREVLRVAFGPTSVTAGGASLPRLTSVAQLDSQEGYTFEASGDAPGVLRVRHDLAAAVSISGPPDTTPPAPVDDLAAGNPTSDSITLTWTAPGDDGDAGIAAVYDIRYRTDGPVTESSWASAVQVEGEPAPAAAGVVQSFLVPGLAGGRTYHFAIRTADEASWSAISNSPNATTTFATTIGYGGDGSVGDPAGRDYVNAFRYQAASDLIVTTMHVRIHTGAAGKLKLAIYADSGGSPGGFLRSTEERSTLGTGWQTFQLTASQPLVRGSYYWLVVWTNDNGYLIWAANEPSACAYTFARYQASWPSPFPSNPSHSPFRYSLYAEGVNLCAGQPPPDCDDGNSCTDDGCDPSTGCVHSNNTAPCNDGNACTQTDACQSGTCVGTNSVVCDDGNSCTDDSCNPATGGCLFVPDDGNACTDGNICTSDHCGGGLCLHTASGACGVSGAVHYYRSHQAPASEPSTKPVPNVGIDTGQDGLADATTGSTGTYSVGSLFGNVMVNPLPKFGNPRAADHNNSVSALDVSEIARAAVGLVTFSPNQRIAGDVTGNGTLGALDASEVARFVVGLVDHFPVATTTGSDWKFLRCDAYAYPGDPGCEAPSYGFTPLFQPETGRGFYAVFYGDVTGNWQPQVVFSSASFGPTAGEEESAAAALSARIGREVQMEVLRRAGSGPADLYVTGWSTPLRAGERRQVTIGLRDADGIRGLDMLLRYDPTRVTIVGVQTTGVGSGFSLAENDSAGTFKVSAYGVLPLAGSGPILALTIEAKAPAGGRLPIEISGIANEGEIPLRVVE